MQKKLGPLFMHYACINSDTHYSVRKQPLLTIAKAGLATGEPDHLRKL